jgi:hypothetical protein
MKRVLGIMMCGWGGGGWNWRSVVLTVLNFRVLLLDGKYTGYVK